MTKKLDSNLKNVHHHPVKSPTLNQTIVPDFAKPFFPYYQNCSVAPQNPPANNLIYMARPQSCCRQPIPDQLVCNMNPRFFQSSIRPKLSYGHSPVSHYQLPRALVPVNGRFPHPHYQPRHHHFPSPVLYHHSVFPTSGGAGHPVQRFASASPSKPNSFHFLPPQKGINNNFSRPVHPYNTLPPRPPYLSNIQHNRSIRQYLEQLQHHNYPNLRFPASPSPHSLLFPTPSPSYLTAPSPLFLSAPSPLFTPSCSPIYCPGNDPIVAATSLKWTGSKNLILGLLFNKHTYIHGIRTTKPVVLLYTCCSLQYGPEVFSIPNLI